MPVLKPFSIWLGPSNVDLLTLLDFVMLCCGSTPDPRADLVTLHGDTADGHPQSASGITWDCVIHSHSCQRWTPLQKAHLLCATAVSAQTSRLPETCNIRNSNAAAANSALTCFSLILISKGLVAKESSGASLWSWALIPAEESSPASSELCLLPLIPALLTGGRTNLLGSLNWSKWRLTIFV